MAQTETEEDTTEQRIAELELILHKEPQRYDEHVEYITLLREGDLADPAVAHKLRHARERMSSLFPLSPTLWQEWIADEQKIATDEDDYARIASLFERAHDDYLSPILWIQHCQYMRTRASQISGAADQGGEAEDGDEDDSSEDSEDDEDSDDEDMTGSSGAKRSRKGKKLGRLPLEAVAPLRDLYDRALAACGQHFTMGAMVWQESVNFERQVLSALAESGAEESELENQSQSVLRLYEKMVAVPMLGVEDAWEKYSDVCASLGVELNSAVQSAHEAAKKLADQYMETENSIMDAADDAQKLALYPAYAKGMEKDAPERAQCVYERMVAELPTSADAWGTYLSFMDRRVLKLEAEKALKVHARSVRNCPWSLSIWQEYILAMETVNKGYDDIKKLFEAALASAFPSPTDYIELWISYLDFHFRRIPRRLRRGKAEAGNDAAENAEPTGGSESSGGDPVGDWRAVLDMALQYMNNYIGADSDPEHRLQLYGARIEADALGDIESARQRYVQCTTTTAPGRHQYRTWTAFLSFERQHGTLTTLNQTYRQALHEVSDYPEALAQEWLRFVKEESGDLQQYLTARRQVHERLAVVARRADQHQEQQQQQHAAQKRSARGRTKPTAEPDARAEGKAKAKSAGKRAGAAADSGRKAAPAAQDSTTSKSVGKEASVDADRATNEEGRPLSKKFKAQPVEEDVAMAGEVADHGDQEGQKPTHFVPSEDSIKRTVVVKNLSFDVTADVLRERFADCGTIKDVRIPMKNNRSKGFAYIEFEDPVSTNPALSKDRQFLEGRPMLIEPCVADSSQRKVEFKHNTDLDRHSLFVKNVDYNASEEEIKRLFGKYGAVKEIRSVTKFDGSKRDFCYVEFFDESHAAAALLAMDGYVLHGRALSVALSNPPKRRTGAERSGDSDAAGSAGETSHSAAAPLMIPRTLGAKGRGRGGGAQRIGLQLAAPMSASSGSDGKPAANEASGQPMAAKPKSNADFKALFLSGKK